MDSSIVAALISASSSIILAVISRAHDRQYARQHPDSSPRYRVVTQHRALWCTVIGLLVTGVVSAAFTLHHDLAAGSMLVVPLVLWILSTAAPIRPAYAAAIALLICPLAFAAEPLAKWHRGSLFDNHFESAALVFLVGYAFTVAMITWGINRWRVRRPIAAGDDQSPLVAPHPVMQGTHTLTKGLAELADLHRDGILTDEEFGRSKDKLIS